MIDFLHFLRDTDIFVYYVFCYGMLIFGSGYILSFLAIKFCAFICWIEEHRQEKNEKYIDGLYLYTFRI